MAVNAFEVFAKIGADTSGFDSALDGIKGALKSFGGFVTDTMKKAGSYMYGFAQDAVNTGKNFDSAMAGVAATLGKSVDEVQDLRDFAKQMGETTRYSALEAAEGLNYMALAGYDAEKSMKMLPEVMNLASAGAMDLGYASDVITDAQSALGLSIEQTSTLINQMAKTASSSNTNVAQLGEAILQVGGTAKDMKGGTLELATVLGILANNGMKGAEGGTHLRNMLTSLTKSTGEAKEIMEEYNISLYDSKGEMRSFNDVFADMNKAFSKMTTQERKTALSTIFNARDLKAAEALLASAGNTFDELQNKIADAEGAAVQMAKTQEDTLVGAETLFKSAVEGLKINISEMLTPALTEFTKFKTNVVSTVSEAAKRIGESFKKDGFSGLLTSFTKEFSQIKTKALDYGIDILTNITQSISGNAKKIGESAVSFVSNFASKIADSDILGMLGKAALDIIDGVAEGLSSQDSIAHFFEASGQLLTGIASGVGDFLTGENGKGGLLGAAEKIINNVSEWFENPDNRQKFIDGSREFIKSLRDGMVEVLGKSSDILFAACKLFLDVFVGNIDYDHGADVFLDSLWKSIKKNAKAAMFDFGSGDPDHVRIQELWQEYGGGMKYKDFEEKYIAESSLLNPFQTEEDILREMGVYYNKGKNTTSNLEQKIETQQRDELRHKDEELWDALKGTIYGEQALAYSKTHDIADIVDYEEKLYRSRQRAMYGDELKGKSDAEIEQWLSTHTMKGYNEWWNSLDQADKIRLSNERASLPHYGDGGIVTKPTRAIIGERGEPEAVVPLGHETETSRALGLGGGITVQFGDIYVQGGENAGRDFINQVNEQLRNLEIRQLRGIGGTAWQH